jgi:hypothetical protein
VQHLERGGDLDASRTRVAAQLGGQQQERGAQPLATRGEDVVSEQGDQLGLAGELLAQGALDQLEGPGDALEDERKGLALAGGLTRAKRGAKTYA